MKYVLSMIMLALLATISHEHKRASLLSDELKQTKEKLEISQRHLLETDAIAHETERRFRELRDKIGE